MARLDYVIGVERRPCYVGGKKAMFHMWINRAWVAPPSMAVGGHAGGQLWEVFGVVEFEDGHVETVYPKNIQFADGGGFGDAAWGPRVERKAVVIKNR